MKTYIKTRPLMFALISLASAYLATVCTLNFCFFAFCERHSFLARTADEKPRMVDTRERNCIVYKYYLGVPYIVEVTVNSCEGMHSLSGRMSFAESLTVSHIDIDVKCEDVLYQSSNIRSLTIYNCDVTPRTMQIVSGYSELKFLSLCPRFMSIQCFDEIETASPDELYIQLTGDSQRQAFRVPRSARHITVLTVRVDAMLVGHLARAERLRNLHLITYDFMDADLSVLCSSETLQSIKLTGPRINKQSMHSCADRVVIRDTVFREGFVD